MRFDYTHRYAASPARVVELLRDPGFVAALADRAEARDHSVEVSGDDVTITLLVATPDAAAGYLGSTLTVRQSFHFEPPAPDGSLTGTLAIEVPGAPVDAHATIGLLPGEAGSTTSQISGELTVRVPLFGRSLEQQAEPIIAKGLAEIEATAAEWLN